MNLQERAQRIHSGLAGPADFEGLSQDDIIAIKGDQSEMHFRFIPSIAVVERAAGEEEARPQFRHVASDESVDGMGDIILVAGWQLDRFQKNPQLLWAHDQRGLPIGQVDRVWKGRADGTKALLTESHLHPGDLNPQAVLIERMIEAGALRGVSVAFLPKAMHYPKDEEERKEIGLGEWGALIKEQELMELSVVPIPANANSLQRKSLDERAQRVFESARDQEVDPELIEHVRVALTMSDEEQQAIRRRYIVVPDVKEAVARLVDAVEEPELAAHGSIPVGADLAADVLGNQEHLVLPLTSTLAPVASKTIDALERASKALNRAADRIERLTEGAEVAAGGDEPTDAPTTPDGGEDFMADVLDGLADALQ